MNAKMTIINFMCPSEKQESREGAVLEITKARQLDANVHFDQSRTTLTCDLDTMKEE